MLSFWPILRVHMLIGFMLIKKKRVIIKIFKDVGFNFPIVTDLKVADFLNITFNLSNGTCQPYKKANDSLLYVKRAPTTQLN